VWRASVLFLAVAIGTLFATVLGKWTALPIIEVLSICLLFILFAFYFFRDPNPRVPKTPGVIVAPAHGKVDAVEEMNESDVMGGRCLRISIFLSIFDVHVQNAPVAGRIDMVRHCPGQFLNAMKRASATQNENLLVCFQSLERPDEKIGVRLIAGFIARRIVAWILPGDEVARGDRIGLIQFGSRCDLYLPTTFQILVKRGDHVVGGETIVATREQPTPSDTECEYKIPCF
jgi:phosphatidylserine decarboxylase